MTLHVLHLDNHLLVVVKPAGMPVQKDRTGDADLLSAAKNFIKDHFGKPGRVYLGLVHRLDRPVSGVMIFARTSKAAARLAQQFRESATEKRYIALAEATLKGGGQFVDYLVKEHERVRTVDKRHPGGRYAALSWRALASRDGLTLLDIRLETGRPHQIRVQFASRGFPLLGDLRYGALRRLDGRNLALHCYRLGLAHPVLHTDMLWTAPPPASWQGFFDAEIEALLQPVSV